MSKFRKRAIPPKKQKSYIGYIWVWWQSSFCLQATTHLMLLKGFDMEKKKVPKKTEPS
jgi:hypothetical protein